MMNTDLPIRPRLSIGILTKNEERLIGECVRNALFADEVFLLDSGSKDNNPACSPACGAALKA